MANPVSDMKWNTIFAGFSPNGDDANVTEGSFSGGVCWFSTYTTAGSNTQWIRGEDWHLYDLSDYDETVHVDLAHAYEIKMLKFNNNVELVLSLFNYGPDPTIIMGKTRYKFQGNYVDTPYADCGGFDTAGNFTSVAAAKTYGVRVALCTNYTGTAVQLAGGVIEDVTAAYTVGFYILLPVQYGSGMQSWVNVVNSTMCMNHEEFPEAAVTLPDGFYYPIGWNTGRSYTWCCCQYTDFDTMITDIQNANPNIPVRIPIPKKGVGDPEQEVDPSNTGGGGGNFDDTSDPIDFPGLPTGGPIAAGSTKSFLVSDTHIKSVFRRLWNSSLFDVVTWQKIIEEPLDAIVSLICIPVTPTYDANGAHIQLGNIDTEVVAPVVTNQYVTVDCGKLKIPEYWGSALDYSPYTKVDIFIPGCGIKPLKAEDVIGVDLWLKYNFDVLTGNFTASLKCGISVLYKFQGNLKATVPITSRIFDALEAVMKGAGSVAASYATGAMTAESRPDATPETVNMSANTAAAGAAINSAINVAMSKVQLTRCGDISGSTGLLDDFTPYVIIHRPKQSLANDFKKFKGYPSNITSQLGSLAGYTEVEYIHLTGIDGATDTELEMIESLLKGGVIL